MYSLHRHFAVSLLHTSPTTTGRMPLSFLGRAVRFPPARNGARLTGASPLARRFTKAVHRSTTSSLYSVVKQFFKCIGRSADGPPPDKRWKERMHYSTRSELIWGTKALLALPKVFRSIGWLLEGCFSLSLAVASAV